MPDVRQPSDTSVLHMKRRAVLIAIASFAALLSWGLYSCRLALQSDTTIAARLASCIQAVRTIDQAHTIFGRQYQVGPVAHGSPWGALPGVPDTAPSFTVLVGEYRLPFITSVEALVVFQPEGGLHRVLIRRTTDAF